MRNTFFMALFYSVKRKKLALSLFIVLLSIFSILLAPGQARAETTPGGDITNPVVRAVDIAKPAVVRIITTLGGRLTVHFTDQQSATFPLSGGNYNLQLSGSGTFISSHGDILTADHVIQPPRDKSMDDVLEMTAAKDVANYINDTFHPTTPYTEEDTYANMHYGIFRSTASYNKPTSEVYLSKDYAGVINATKLSEVSQDLHARVDQIKKESAVDERDVAIIHINMNDTPSVHLGDSSNVSQQDELTIIGFPGNGDLGDPQTPDPTSFLTSSVNKIYVSSIKTSSGGGQVIQVGGNVEHGDSGGPALDRQGNIIGVVSFYNQFAQAPIGTSFLQAGNSANQLLTGLNLDLKPGKFQQAWEQAFKNYTGNGNDHWHRAYAAFHKLQQDYPNFQAVTPFMDYTSSQSLHEKLPEKSAPNAYLMPLIIASIIIGIVILILAILAWFLWSRRSKARLAYQSSAQAAPTATAYPAYTAYPSAYAGYTGNGSQPQQPLAPGIYHQAATPASPMAFNQQQVPQTPPPVAGWQAAPQYPFQEQPSDVPVESSEPAHSLNGAATHQQTAETPNNAANPIQAHFPIEGNARDNGIATKGTQIEKMEQWPVEIPDQPIAHADAPTVAEANVAPLASSEQDHDLTHQQMHPEKSDMTQKLPRIRVPSAKVTGKLDGNASPQPSNN